MGVNESHESVTPLLQALSSLPDPTVEKALTSLDARTRLHLQMQVSKWDVLSMLQLKPIQVAHLIETLTERKSRDQVNCHSLTLLLVLSRRSQTVTEKIREVMKHICFQLNAGEV
jgi:hypothetical protein